jgi:surface polysaccharide O-acyltransferase-like enzyme
MMQQQDPAAPAVASPPPRTSGREYIPVLDVLRIAAILGVIVVHVVGGGVEEGSVGIGVTVLDMAASAAVPVFLMMTGGLNLHPAAHRRGPGSFWRRRAVRVLPALVVWSAVYMLVVDPIAGADLNWGIALDEIITGKTAVHLYFLWAVIGLYALAPIIAAFLHAPGAREGRRAWWLGLLACAWTLLVFTLPYLTAQTGIDGLTQHRPVEPGSLTYGLAFAGYFVLGRAAIIAPVRRRTGIVLLALCPLLIALASVLYELGRGDPDSLLLRTLRSDYTSPVVMAYSIALFTGVLALTLRWRVHDRAARVLRTLGNATFGVFLVHFAILVLLRQLPFMDGYYALWQMALALVVVVPVSFALSLGAQRVPGVRLIF